MAYSFQPTYLSFPSAMMTAAVTASFTAARFTLCLSFLNATTTTAAAACLAFGPTFLYVTTIAASAATVAHLDLCGSLFFFQSDSDDGSNGC